MIVYCVGNVLLEHDNLPLLLMDRLQDEFPQHECIEADPNENFFPEEGSVILDTVIGVDKVTVFTDIETFFPAPHVSVHDYDLSFHLKFLKKVGKLPAIKIIGIPQGMDEQLAFNEVLDVIKSVS
jgi:hypothetical protein